MINPIKLDKRDQLLTIGGRKRWIAFHNDLSGRCWVDDPRLGKGDGWYIDTPRRFYINSTWWGMSISPFGDDTYLISVRRSKRRFHDFIKVPWRKYKDELT